MKIALTGATGFIGRYIAAQLIDEGHAVRAWHRAGSDTAGLPSEIEWHEGELNDALASERLVVGCDALVHGALYRPGAGFRGAEGDLSDFVDRNVGGSIKLFEAARKSAVKRVVFISTCAVHDVIMSDRPLDEAHPTWSKSHYGAHKAAIEDFVHSYGKSGSLDICAVRPTGVYGVNHPVTKSKWYSLIEAVVRGEDVSCENGGKEVHAADVARAVRVLLKGEGVAGECYNCYDRYISDFEVAQLAKELSGSKAKIAGTAKRPQNEIQTGKIRALGMQFGGEKIFRDCIAELVASIK